MLALSSDGIPFTDDETIIEFLRRYEGARIAYPLAYGTLDENSKERLDVLLELNPVAMVPEPDDREYSDMLQSRDVKMGIVDINRLRQL